MISLKKISSAIPLILWAAISSPAQSQSAPLGPVELWEKVSANNPQLLEARARINEAESNAQGSNAGFLPKLDLRGAWQQFRTRADRAASSSESKNYSIVASQQIFNRRLWNDIDREHLNLEVTKAGYRVIETNLRLELLQDYWQLLRLNESIDILSRELAGPLTDLENQAQQSITAGIRTPSDLSLYLMQIATMRLDLLRLEAEQEDYLERLDILVGERISSLRKRRKEYVGSIAVKIPRRVTPKVLVEELALRIEENGVKGASSAFWPTLALESSFERSINEVGISANEQNFRNDSSLGLILTVPLFNGFSDFQARQAAKSRVLAANIRRAALDKENEINAQYSSKRIQKAYDRLAQSIKLWTSAIDLEKSVLRRQDAGLSSFDYVIGPRIQALNMTILKNEALFEYLGLMSREYAEAGSLDDEAFVSFEKNVLAE